MSICLPFLLYVCGFFSKDHAYTSIEDSMAIGDPRVVSYNVSYSLTIYRHPCAHAFYYMKRKRKKEGKYIHFRNLQTWY